MLSAAARSRLTVVLVGARNPQNIGAAARALHDFGFASLRIVNEFSAPFEAAQLQAKSAVAAEAVMAAAQRFDTLPEAIADCTLIVATTAIGDRQLTRPILPLQQAAPLLFAHLTAHLSAHPGSGGPFIAESHPAISGEPQEIEQQQPHPHVALLFGSEKTGLTNEQLSHASLLTTIPMFQPDGARHLSMNLGQSVAVCLYELTRPGLEGAREIPDLHEAPATAADRERLTEFLLTLMQITGYTRRYPHNATPELVRHLCQQLGSSHREAMTWMGILRQLQWHKDSIPKDLPLETGELLE
jgi:tRNA C32,U32 (ribose-2'-O)-methylase TrmJ